MPETFLLEIMGCILWKFLTQYKTVVGFVG